MLMRPAGNSRSARSTQRRSRSMATLRSQPQARSIESWCASIHYCASSAALRDCSRLSSSIPPPPLRRIQLFEIRQQPQLRAR